MRRSISLVAAGFLVCGCNGSPDGREVPEARASGRSDAPDTGERRSPVILFLGTSLTAGLGVGRDEAYPARVQRKIDSAGLDFRVVNAGVSGETSAGGVRRIDWLLREPVAVLVLELGANDGLRGQDIDTLRDNLRTIIDRTRSVHPEAAIVVAGMRAPPNLGRRYTNRFRSVFRDVARAADAALIPFLLEGVAGRAELNQADGIHPTAEGHRMIAETVWETLRPLLPPSPSPRSPS